MSGSRERRSDALGLYRARRRRPRGLPRRLGIGADAGLQRRRKTQADRHKLRLRSLLFQPSPLVLQLTTSSGQEMVFRLVPSLVEQGILLNPLLMTNPDILRLYDGQIGTRVRSLRVISVDNDAGYQDNIRVTLKSIANLERISN